MCIDVGTNTPYCSGPYSASLNDVSVDILLDPHQVLFQKCSFGKGACSRAVMALNGDKRWALTLWHHVECLNTYSAYSNACTCTYSTLYKLAELVILVCFSVCSHHRSLPEADYRLNFLQKAETTTDSKVRTITRRCLMCVLYIQWSTTVIFFKCTCTCNILTCCM